MSLTNPTIQQLMDAAIAQQAGVTEQVKTASVEEPGLYDSALSVANGLEKVAQAIMPEQAAELQNTLTKIFGPERAQVLFQRLDEIKMRQDQMAQPTAPVGAPPPAAPPAAPPVSPAGAAPQAPGTIPPQATPEKLSAVQRLQDRFSGGGNSSEYSQLSTLIADFGKTQ